MAKDKMNLRVAELSATLKPIQTYYGWNNTTCYLQNKAQDFLDFNESFGRMVSFEDTVPCCLLDTVENYQVLRFYEVNLFMQCYDADDCPDPEENYQAFEEWMMTRPELQVKFNKEFKQIWIPKDNNEENVILAEQESCDKDLSFIVNVVNLTDWAFEPKFVERIKKLVNEEQMSDPKNEMYYAFSKTNEYLSKNEPMFRKAIHNANHEDIANRYYRTFRIAHRHGWRFPDNPVDARTYIDYLSMLRSEGFDLFNPKYVCPRDINEAHNWIVNRSEKKKLQKLIQEARDYESQFNEIHAGLTGITFNTERFVFTSLDSAEQYVMEGHNMHHCIGRCKYYKHENEISFHIADLEGNRVATCTINLERSAIIELQTLCNNPIWREGDEYKEIWNTIMARMHTFPKCRKSTEKLRLQSRVA